MTGEPEGLQPTADEQVEEAAAAPASEVDSPPLESPEADAAATNEGLTPPAETPEPASPDAPPPAEEPVQAAAESAAPPLSAAFSDAPSLPQPKPTDLGPAPKTEAPAVPPVANVGAEPAAEAVAPAEPSGVPGLPELGSVGEDVSEEELKAIDDALYEHLIEEYAAGGGQAVEGERRDGVIVSVGEDAAVVDIGGKTEAALSRGRVPEEFDWAALQPGAKIAVYIASLGAGGEFTQLGLARQENTEAWDALEAALADKRTLEATVEERVKGGLAVNVEGLTVFMPGSQTGLRGGQDLDALIGQTLPVRVVKVSRRRGNAVVSHRELLEEAAAATREAALAKIAVDDIVEGIVKNVTSYGAFVDLGGVDGLIHVTDISYGRVKDPASVLEPGQKVSAKVIKTDSEKGRVSLSLKATAPDPWENVADRFEPGARVSGKIASVTDYGAFLELDDGVEGLVHISEMTWSKRLRHPAKILAVGQDAEAVVLKVQPTERRISLSMKLLRPDPWESVPDKYQAGAIVEGRVRNVTSYGAFVELEEGVDGLVHVSDLSWDQNVKDPKQVLKKGQPVRAVVLDVDTRAHRISLGVKQLEPDAWETYFGAQGVGDIVVGEVVRLAKFGAFVELAPSVEGLCHNSQMPGRGPGRRGTLEKERRYEFEIIKVDELDRRVGLRCVNPEPLEASAEAGKES